MRWMASANLDANNGPRWLAMEKSDFAWESSPRLMSLTAAIATLRRRQMRRSLSVSATPRRSRTSVKLVQTVDKDSRLLNLELLVEEGADLFGTKCVPNFAALFNDRAKLC